MNEAQIKIIVARVSEAHREAEQFDSASTIAVSVELNDLARELGFSIQEVGGNLKINYEGD